MRIIIKKDTAEVGDWAATYIIDKIKKANPIKGKTIYSRTAYRIFTFAGVQGIY